MHFLRYNHFPVRRLALADERKRLETDEARFGGEERARGEVVYSEGDSVYFFHSPRPTPALETPEEWLLRVREEEEEEEEEEARLRARSGEKKEEWKREKEEEKKNKRGKETDWEQKKKNKNKT